MSPFCLETAGLTYRFSRHNIVLDNLDLRVPEGSIYGFLGPNGAGKTTTLRLVLGLLRRQQGRISFFGHPYETSRLATLKKVGSLIESPSIYGQLTAVENLLVWQKIYGCPKDRIATVLEWVGLANTGRKAAGKFSLGMKQRLGIAVALLNDPALLILDEPTNGLDPAGMVEIRALLQQLNHQQGVTILLSSHLLWEMQKLVTYTGIIHQGRLLYQGPLDQLMAKHEGDLETIFIKLTQH